MSKFCIFCGKKPVKKNKEHVLPKWLINLTGAPNRITTIGQKDGKKIKFPWMKFVFPSCEECNSAFGKIEGQVKSVVIKLLESKRVTHKEFDLFLDWLDKVRIGVWLGQSQLYKREINPNFYINQRVGEKDRLCLIYKSSSDEKGIAIIGTEVPLFVNAPSCFGLVINNLFFFNYSRALLLSENMGFPYPDNYYHELNGMIRLENLKLGTHKIKMPFLEGKKIKPSVKFYQTIIRCSHGLHKPRLGKANKFFKRNSLLFNKEIIKSRIYVSDEFENYNQYWEKGKKLKFDFKQKFDMDALGLSLAKMVLNHQIAAVRNSFNHIDELDESEKEYFIEYSNRFIQINENKISMLNESLMQMTKKNK